MKKSILLALALICCVTAFAQKGERLGLKGLNVGVGAPVEFYDLKAVGANLHVGFDRTYPISDKFALGFYLSAGGGALFELHPQYQYDKVFSMFKFSAGLLMEIGELDKKPFLVGIGPGTGVGFLDMDLILPVEIRFGRLFSNHWYVMGEIDYGYSLAEETISVEPVIRIGYNFGHSRKR
jgi:hypothetical protein